MKRFDPPSTEATDPFWEGTRQRRYLVQWCGRCGRPIFHPREACPGCLGDDALEWRESSGRGEIYASSVQHRPAHPGMADLVPYVVALVTLDAGDGESTIRVMSNIVDCDPDSVAVGDQVELAWEEMPDGRHLAVFRPVG